MHVTLCLHAWPPTCYFASASIADTKPMDPAWQKTTDWPIRSIISAIVLRWVVASERV